MKLGVYQNQVSLDTGADTFSPVPDTGAAIAQGVANLGQGLFSAGLRLAKADTAIQAKIEARIERDAGYRDEAEYIRISDRIEQFATDHKNKVGDDAAGYARAVSEFAEKTYLDARNAGRLTGSNNAKHDLMYERIRNRAEDRAAAYEADTRMKFRAAVGEATAGRLVAEVGTVGASAVPSARAEWQEFVGRTEGDTRLGRKMLEIGLHRIERAAFEVEARRRAVDFVGKFQGTFSDNPSATTDNPMVNAALKYAPANGLDPKVAVAIGWIESTLRADHDGPKLPPGAPAARGRKGATHMSSAEGGWQILDSVATTLGLSIADKKDPEKSTAAVMGHFANNAERLRSLGHEASPGKLYMYWNVGGPVAERMLKADPSTPVENVVYAAYPSDPGFASQVLRNNPSMYRAGMTVGQVMANYEAKVSSAMKATAGYFGGSASTNQQMSAIAAEFLGGVPTHITSNDVAEVYAAVSKDVKEAAGRDRKVALGFSFLNNPGTADVYSSEDKKAINAAVDEALGNSVLQGVAAGDVNAHVQARQVIQAAGFIPDRVLHGFRSALDGQYSDAAMRALVTLADVQKSNPQAYGASSLQADEKDAVTRFVAMTEVMGLDEAAAAKRVMFERSPEGKKAREVTKALFQNQWRSGGTELQADERAWADIRAAFDRSWFSTPGSDNPVNRAAIVEAYQQSTLHHMSQGAEFADAKALALVDLKRVWGVSSVAGNRAQTLMPFAPEAVLGPERALNGSFSWVREQARNFVAQDIAATKRDVSVGASADGVPAAFDDFYLVPAPGSAAKMRSGHPVEYFVRYRDRSGRVQQTAQPFVPDYRDAAGKSERDFREQRRSKSTSMSGTSQTDDVSISGIIAP